MPDGTRATSRQAAIARVSVITLITLPMLGPEVGLVYSLKFLPEWWDALISFCVPVICSVSLFFAAMLAASKRYKIDEARDIRTKVDRLTAALTEAAELSESLAADLKARRATLERLQAEAEQWENIAKLRKTEAEAVTRLVNAEVAKGVRHGDRMGWLFAAVGLIVAVGVVAFGAFIPTLGR